MPSRRPPTPAWQLEVQMRQVIIQLMRLLPPEQFDPDVGFWKARAETVLKMRSDWTEITEEEKWNRVM